MKDWMKLKGSRRIAYAARVVRVSLAAGSIWLADRDVRERADGSIWVRKAALENKRRELIAVAEGRLLRRREKRRAQGY